jgi:hypothetical protein
LNYFTMPILFKAGYAGEVFRIYGLVGPYVGIALSGKEKVYQDKIEQDSYTVEFGEGETSDAETTTGGFKGYKANRLDVGVTIGLEPCVKLGPGEIFLDLRYSLGFIDIDHPTDSQKQDYNDWASDNDELAYYKRCQRAFGLSFGYIFRLGGK